MENKNSTLHSETRQKLMQKHFYGLAKYIYDQLQYLRWKWYNKETETQEHIFTNCEKMLQLKRNLKYTDIFTNNIKTLKILKKTTWMKIIKVIVQKTNHLWCCT